MKLCHIRHEGKGVTIGAPPRAKGAANGVPGEAAPVPGVAVGGELVAVDETDVLVALKGDSGGGRCARSGFSCTCNSGGCGRCRSHGCRHCKKKLKIKSNYFELLASEVVKLGSSTTWIHDRKGVIKVVQQTFSIISADLS